ncbi:MAG: SPASM domain-containing protein [Lentisphaerae bacterium]|nr:SPASM domain-containing protein [Lentisphaerota bacterium]
MKRTLEILRKAARNPHAARRRAALILKRLAILNLQPSRQPTCPSALREAVILSDGTVTSCCFDSKGVHGFGNIFQEPFEDIWARGFREFRRRRLLERPLCFNCVGNENAISPSLWSTPEERASWTAETVPPPESLVIEVSGRCNYACEGCFANELAKHRSTELNLDALRENARGVLGQVQYLRLYNYGEPMMNSAFPEMLHWIGRNAPQADIVLATNAILMGPENINAILDSNTFQVSVSVHGGPGTENMMRYSLRGADYDLALRNTRALIDARERRGASRPKVRLKAVLFNWNDSDELMDRLREDGRRVRADAVVWTLDHGSGQTTRASRRFLPGSRNLEELKSRGEFA